MDVLGALAFLAGAFLLGAVPWGVILTRWRAGVDVRGYGSGSTGSTNALRVAGGQVAVAVLALDAAKGFLPALAARTTGEAPWLAGAVGVAAVVGHCWSPFIGFHGGKGVATATGATAALWPWALSLLPLVVVLAARTGFASLACLVPVALVAIAAIGAIPVGAIAWPTSASILAMAAIVFGRHRGNIRRLLQGTERRFNEPAEPRR